MSDYFSGWLTRNSIQPPEVINPMLSDDYGSGSMTGDPTDQGPNPGVATAGNVGTVGGLLGGAVGLATGIGGLGLAGSGLATGLAGMAASNELQGLGAPGLGFGGIASGVANSMTGGLIGTSIDAQMADAMSPASLGIGISGSVPGIDTAVAAADMSPAAAAEAEAAADNAADNAATSAAGFGPDGGIDGGDVGGFGDTGDTGGFGGDTSGDAASGDTGGYGGDADSGGMYADGGRVGWLNGLPENPTEDDLPEFEARVGGRRPALLDRDDVRDRISRQASDFVKGAAHMLLPQSPEQAALMVMGTPAMGLARPVAAAGLGLLGFSRGAGERAKPGYADGGLMGMEPMAPQQAYNQDDPSARGAAQSLQMWQLAKGLA